MHSIITNSKLIIINIFIVLVLNQYILEERNRTLGLSIENKITKSVAKKQAEVEKRKRNTAMSETLDELKWEIEGAKSSLPSIPK